MKYLPLICALILLGAGCTATQSKSTMTEGYSTNAPVMHTPQDQDTSQDSSPSSMTDQRTLPNQQDLAAEYAKAILHTSLGDITVSLYADKSPVTVNNFLNLAEAGEYNGTKFHRVIQDFMIQGGDLLSKDDSKEMMWGTGGPEYRFSDEFNDAPLVRGSLAMANAGPNTNGSQFFIVTAPETPWLDGKHTNFGMVVEGMDVVDTIEKTPTNGNDRPLTPVVLESIELVK